MLEEITDFKVTRSANGMAWHPRITSPQQERMAQALAQQHGMPELLARVLAGREVTTDDVDDFLNPTLKRLMPDPAHLHDMDKTVARLIRAIENKEIIAVFGDYDVDGATSTALLARYFAALGINILTYIPDRMKEGYGPNREAFDLLRAQEAKVIVTVDCGTTSYEPIAFAAQHGIDVLVVDHHTAQAQLPQAYAVVNPNRIDQDSPCGHLAAVGVVFMLVVAMNRALRDSGYFTQHDLPEPNLLQWLDLVALGTVCDVVSLTGLNRAFVAQGLKVMAQRGNPGIAALSDVARMDDAPGVYHAGFLIGPRINAGGRVGESGLGSRLLTLNDAETCRIIAQQLDEYNAERQAIESSVLDAALLQAESQANQPCIIVASQGWHEGVIGIVAGRIKEKYDRPAAVIRIADGMGKGSARSVSGADMGAAIISARELGLLTAGGGHAMAAGFSLDMTQFDAFCDYMLARLAPAVERYSDTRAWKYDGLVSVEALTTDLIDRLESAGPFGMGNPGPKLVVPNARILVCDRMKDKHLRVILTDRSSRRRVTAVTFNSVGSPLGDILERSVGHTVHLAGNLRRNRFNGQESAQFFIEDAAEC